MVPGNWNSTVVSDILSSKRMRFTDDEAQISDERRQINSRISNERSLETMENNFLTLKDDNGSTHSSPVLIDFLRQISVTRKSLTEIIIGIQDMIFRFLWYLKKTNYHTIHFIKSNWSDQLTTQMTFVRLQPQHDHFQQIVLTANIHLLLRFRIIWRKIKSNCVAESMEFRLLLL